MSLPKNYQQKVNLPKREKALNDLNFYKISYEYEFTDTYKTALKEGYSTPNLEKIKQEIIGFKEFSALNDEKAKEKINEWLQSFVNENVIKEFEVNEITSQTFNDKIKEKKLDVLIPFHRL